MSSKEQQPLTVLHGLFIEHTDRRPPDEGAVWNMLHAASKRLNRGSSAPSLPSDDLAERLIVALDSTRRGGLGLNVAKDIATIGETLLDTSAERIEKWGAIAYLGLLAMSYRPEYHEGEVDQIDPAEYRSQPPSLLARQALAQIIDRTGEDDFGKKQAALAGALLKTTGIPAEEVMVDIESLILPTEQVKLPIIKNTPVDSSTSEKRVFPPGLFVDEPKHFVLLVEDPNMRAKLGKMDWFPQNYMGIEVPGRAIYKDGEKIATVLDFTQFHDTFKGYVNEIVDQGGEKNYGT